MKETIVLFSIIAATLAAIWSSMKTVVQTTSPVSSTTTTTKSVFSHSIQWPQAPDAPWQFTCNDSDTGYCHLLINEENCSNEADGSSRCVKINDVYDIAVGQTQLHETTMDGELSYCFQADVITEENRCTALTPEETIKQPTIAGRQ